MPFYNVPEFERGRRFRGGEFAETLQQISTLLSHLLTSRGEDTYTGSCGLLTAHHPTPTFWVQVLGNDGQTPPGHSWQQIIEDNETNYPLKPDGLYGQASSDASQVFNPLYDINGKAIPPGQNVLAWRGLGEYFLCDSTNQISWIKVSSSASTSISLGRQVTDGVTTSGSTTITSTTAGFTSSDVGLKVLGTGIPTQRTVSDGVITSGSTTLTSASASFVSGDAGTAISGEGIPSSTTIASVTNSTTVVLSNAATATNTSVSLTIGTYTTISSITDSQTATLSQSATASGTGITLTFASAIINGYDSVIDLWDNTAGEFTAGEDVWFYPANGETPVSGSIYQGRLLGLDAAGKTIWCAASFQQALGLSLGYVTLSSIPHTPPTFNYEGGGSAQGYQGSYSGGACWLLADLNSLFTVAAYPSSGNTWTPPKTGWQYQARFTGKYDTSKLPVFQLASWPLAAWVDNTDNTFTVYAGLISAGHGSILGSQYVPGTFQILPGDKAIAGNFRVGEAVTGSSVGVGGTVDCSVLDANGPAQQGGSNLDAVSGGLVTTINAAGNITVGGFQKATISFSTNGQFPTGSSFSPLPDSQFLSLAATAPSLYTGTGYGISIGTESIAFGGGGGSQPSIFISAGDWLEGFTGSLSDGSQVVSGWVVNAGGDGGGSVTVDGGSFW